MRAALALLRVQTTGASSATNSNRKALSDLRFEHAVRECNAYGWQLEGLALKKIQAARATPLSDVRTHR